MGLDMYLEAKRYVSGWNHRPEPEFAALQTLFNVQADTSSPSFNVSFNIGYWRKANHIHKWFVDNVQDGTDEGQETDVSREELLKLKEACTKVLSIAQTMEGKILTCTTYSGDKVKRTYKEGPVIINADDVAKILPTQAGFFFGNTEYNEYYIEDVKDTITIIDRALALPKSWDFSYRASW